MRQPIIPAVEEVIEILELLTCNNDATVPRDAFCPTNSVPLFNTRIASVAPLLPVWKMMSAPVVPTPLVERRESVLVVVVPPITRGTVAEVVIVCAGSVVESDGTPLPSVTRMLLLAEARSETVLLALAYSSRLAVTVAG